MKERRVWTPEQKYNLVLEVLQGNKTVADTCRDNQISTNQFYKWRDLFLQSALQGLHVSIFPKWHTSGIFNIETLRIRTNRLLFV